MWFWIMAFVLNDVLIGFTFWQLWRKNFFRHIVYCENCDSPQIVADNIEAIVSCENCHVCSRCGKYMICDTCGKRHLVRQEVDKINFCDGIGCFEKYKLNQEKLKK
jgi:ABC-type nickel/cobalt efflux system permease component RcnA